MSSVENIIPLFSTPLYFVENPKEIFRFSDDQLKLIKELEYVPDENNYVSSNNQVLELPWLSELKNFIQQHVHRYTDKFIDNSNDNYQFNICSSWITRAKKTECHNFHKHLTSMISGVVNITPENTTVFSRESIGPFPFFSFEYKNPSISFAEKLSIHQERSGCILMFPSDICHAAPPHEGDHDRYALSFNVFPRGNFYTHPEQTMV